ncbi:MAG: NUDIX domain-containing protein [Planctomycetia bacterium]|nr:NUDIX domain-containing protein [Planctomycetia bacterium]
MNISRSKIPSESSTSVLRHGVTGILFRQGRALTIRRSATVIEPLKWCFPGGGIEEGETQEEALMREFQEELGISIKPIRKIWESITPWAVHLNWWTVSSTATTFNPNPAEVDAVKWMTFHELLADPDLLRSNIIFLQRVLAGDISI